MLTGIHYCLPFIACVYVPSFFIDIEPVPCALNTEYVHGESAASYHIP